MSLILLSCNNQYKRYGVLVSLQDRRLGMEISNQPKRKIFLEISRDDFKISNRSILFRLDTTNIFLGKYSKERIEIEVPEHFFNRKFVDPNIYIIEPGNKTAYYFESDDPFTLEPKTNLIRVNF